MGVSITRRLNENTEKTKHDTKKDSHKRQAFNSRLSAALVRCWLLLLTGAVAAICCDDDDDDDDEGNKGACTVLHSLLEQHSAHIGNTHAHAGAARKGISASKRCAMP